MSQSEADRVISTPYSEPAEHGVSCGASTDANEVYDRTKRHDASRATGNNSALERKTVRSGIAYDINGGGGSAESSEHTRRLKEELGSVTVTGIEGRVAYRFVKRVFDIAF